MDLGPSPQPGDAGFPSSAQPCLPCRNRSNSTHQSPPPSGEASREGRQGSTLLCCRVEFIINSNLSLILKKSSRPHAKPQLHPCCHPHTQSTSSPIPFVAHGLERIHERQRKETVVQSTSSPIQFHFFGCCCEKTPIQFFTDGLEKKRERKETGLVYSSIFSNYMES
jgi:hypothetical protein